MKGETQMYTYELRPVTRQKSFYGKAVVEVADDGSQTLLSYGTPILRINADGTKKRLWFGWTATTGKHIRSFCGLNKSGFEALS